MKYQVYEFLLCLLKETCTLLSIVLVYRQSHGGVFGFLGIFDNSTSVPKCSARLSVCLAANKFEKDLSVFGTGTFNKLSQSSLSVESVCGGPVPGFGLTRSLFRVGRLG